MLKILLGYSMKISWDINGQKLCKMRGDTLFLRIMWHGSIVILSADYQNCADMAAFVCVQMKVPYLVANICNELSNFTANKNLPITEFITFYFTHIKTCAFTLCTNRSAYDFFAVFRPISIANLSTGLKDLNCQLSTWDLSCWSNRPFSIFVCAPF